MTPDLIRQQQNECLRLKKAGLTNSEIGQRAGLSKDQVFRRITGAKKAERLDPALRDKLNQKGITDLSGLHSGWLLEKDQDGTGSSLYFYLGPDEEKVDFVEAITEVLGDIPKLPPLVRPTVTEAAKDNATWLMMADLHIGGDYGNAELEDDFNAAVDHLVNSAPPAEKAVLVELGDLLDANDHKGVTPASNNPCDVIRDHSLRNTQTALKLMKRAAYRLLETHAELEIHLIKGNHDPTAHIAVLLALQEHFILNPQVNVVVTDEEYRVIQWGQSACFPHHGDTLKWDQLKDVFNSQYPDEWAQAKAFRLLATAHFHHDRAKDLVGAYARHFRTLHKPNGWAQGKGFFSPGSLTALTVNKFTGYGNETRANIRSARGMFQ